MHSESEWAERIDVNEEHGAAERYAYFMRPEPFRDVNMSGDRVREIDDPILGRVKVRNLLIGMTRNAKEENKKEVIAYLSPFPHTRLEKAKPLQGWYQSKVNESGQSRPRPCFSEAELTSPYSGYCAVGCGFSLPAGELVDTPFGFKAIETFQVGDLVYGKSDLGLQITSVKGTSRHTSPAGISVLTLSDGRQLRMTGDHPIYSVSRATWVRAETLEIGERLEDSSMCGLRRTNQEQEVVSPLLAGVQPPLPQAGSQMSRLRCDDSPLLPRRTAEAAWNSLRGLRAESTFGQRQGEFRSHLRGEAQAADYERQTVSVLYGSRGRDGDTGERAEIEGVQSLYRQQGPRGKAGIPALETVGVQRQERQNLQYEVYLGDSHGETPGREGLRLGLRAFRPVVTERSVPTGLHPLPLQDADRGEGLPYRERPEEDRRGQSHRLDDSSLRRGNSLPAWNPHVVRIERVPGAVEVFDIETGTENFYQRGILVHNCYINSGMRGYRGTGLITVPIDYGAQVRKQLKPTRRGAAGYFSSFTDPFTPLEPFYHNTEEGAKAFVEVGLPIFFLSRLRYPEWAIDLMCENPHSYAQKSINTSDPVDWRHLSPGALPLEEHFDDIRRIKARGIYVSIQVNPIIPGVTDHGDIYRLFKRLASVGTDHVIVKFVEAGYSWAPAMVERMVKRFGDRGREFERLFTCNIGAEKTVDEGYRLKALPVYRRWATALGMTFSTCYEYKYERDATGKILSKVGISVGREFATSDQCHGQRVPVYARDSEHEMFRPLEECPPSGCLHCADENEADPGKPRCGDELAGGAYALEYRDMKVPIGEGKRRSYSLPVMKLSPTEAGGEAPSCGQ